METAKILLECGRAGALKILNDRHQQIVQKRTWQT